MTYMRKKQLPKRIEILRKAFENKWSLEAVNKELEDNLCERLYARNIYEAGLIYAFRSGLDYEEWKQLYTTYEEERKDTEDCIQSPGQNMVTTYEKKQKNTQDCIQKPEQNIITTHTKKPKTIQKTKEKRTPSYTGIWSGKITLKQIYEYIMYNSKENFQTGTVTKELEEKLWKEQKNTLSDKTAISFLDKRKNFVAFMNENQKQFSEVREKARYYFCKYLYFYIEERCENYYDKCRTEETEEKIYGESLFLEYCIQAEKNALNQLTMLKLLTPLKNEAEKAKVSLSLEQRKEYLQNAALSFRGIFNEFNYFYFGFVSLGWVEMLFEFYGPLKDWSEEEKIRIACSLGYCKKNPSDEEKEKAFLQLERLSKKQKNTEKQLDEKYAIGMERAGYQRGRSGETYFRDFITGRRDINRDTLLAFLVFVQAETKLDMKNKLTIARINRILYNCGFAQLRPDREFDEFIRKYLMGEAKEEVLYEAAERAALKGEDFYLYKLYRQAKSCQKELEGKLI